MFVPQAPSRVNMPAATTNNSVSRLGHNVDNPARTTVRVTGNAPPSPQLPDLQRQSTANKRKRGAQDTGAALQSNRSNLSTAQLQQAELDANSDDASSQDNEADGTGSDDKFIKQITNLPIDLSGPHFRAAINSGVLPSDVWNAQTAKALFSCINRSCRLSFFTTWSLEADVRNGLILRWLGPLPVDVQQLSNYNMIVELVRARANHWGRNWQARILDCFEMHLFKCNRSIVEDTGGKSNILNTPGLASYASNHFFEEAPLNELFPVVKNIVDLDLIRSWAHPNTPGLSRRQRLMGQWLNTLYGYTLQYMATLYGKDLIATGAPGNKAGEIKFNLNPAQAAFRIQARGQLVQRLRAVGVMKGWEILKADSWPTVSPPATRNKKQRNSKADKVAIDQIDPEFQVLGGGDADYDSDEDNEEDLDISEAISTNELEPTADFD